MGKPNPRIAPDWQSSQRGSEAVQHLEDRLLEIDLMLWALDRRIFLQRKIVSKLMEIEENRKMGTLKLIAA